jgi:hypothetical protein
MRERLALWSLRTGISALTAISNLSTGLRNGLAFWMGAKYQFKPRPDDVFVAAYAKSGSTLTQMMLHQLTTDGSMGFPHIDAIMPFFEVELLRGGARRIAAMPSPRIFKTHLVRRHLPDQVRYIYIVRNLQDVAVSAYHHHCLVSGMENDFGLYAEAFIQEQVPMFGSWARHLESWWPHRNDPNVLFLRYEEMIRDIEGTVRRIAGFCNLPVDEAAMPRILERCSVAFMKQHTDKFDPRFRRTSNGTDVFIRKGQTGEGATRLSPAQREKLGERVAALAAKLGCSDRDIFGEPSAS